MNWVHALSTAYNPPEEAIAIARRELKTPIVIEKFHPNYQRDKIEFYEIIYLGENFEIAWINTPNTAAQPDWTTFGLRWMVKRFDRYPGKVAPRT